MIGRNKSVGPDGISGAILKIGGEATIPYLARLLDITINNGVMTRVRGTPLSPILYCLRGNR